MCEPNLLSVCLGLISSDEEELDDEIVGAMQSHPSLPPGTNEDTEFDFLT